MAFQGKESACLSLPTYSKLLLLMICFMIPEKDAKTEENA